MTETLVLPDNTVLSNFSVAQQPGLAIEACPGRACTTAAAFAEYLAAPGEERFAEHAWRDLSIIELTEGERQLAEALTERLGVEFWTADRRLWQAVGATLPWVRLLDA